MAPGAGWGVGAYAATTRTADESAAAAVLVIELRPFLLRTHSPSASQIDQLLFNLDTFGLWIVGQDHSLAGLVDFHRHPCLYFEVNGFRLIVGAEFHLNLDTVVSVDD